MSSFALISMAELTASAAVVVALFIAMLGSNLRQRLLVAAGFVAWFCVILTIGATGFFAPGVGIGVAGLGLGVVIPLALLTLLTLGTAAGRQRIQQAPLWAMVGVHGIRVLGINFLLMQAAHLLPAPFAPSAGWGDILAAVLALPLAFALWRAGQSGQAAPSRTWLLLWNTLGIADLVIALFLGASSSPGPIQIFHVTPSTAGMTSLPWLLVPNFLVPSLIFLHIATYYRLATARATGHAEVRTPLAAAS